MSQFRDGSDRPNPHSLWQVVTNKHWPPPGVAKTLRDVAAGAADRRDRARRLRDPAGEQYLAGRAVRWNKHHVCVTIDDPSLQVSYLWLAPGDVRRAGD